MLKIHPPESPMHLATLAVLSFLVSVAAYAQSGPTFRPGGGPWAPLVPLGISPSGEVFASAGDLGDNGSVGDLYTSADEGRSWTRRALGLRAIKVAFTPGVVWAATPSGLRRSGDGGTTWTTELEGWASDVAADGDRVITAISGEARLREGGTWTTLPVPPPQYGDRRAVVVALRGSWLAVGARNQSIYNLSGSLFLSSTDGASWTTWACSGSPTGLELSPTGVAWMGCRDGWSLYNNTDGGLLRLEGSSGTLVASAPVHGVTTGPDGSVWYTTGAAVHRIPADGVGRVVPHAALGRLAVLSEERLLVNTPSITIGYFPDGYSYTPAKGLYAVDATRAVHAGVLPAVVYSVHVDPTAGLLAGGLAGTVHRLDGDAWVPTAVTMARVNRIVEGPDGPLALGSVEPVPSFMSYAPSAASQSLEAPPGSVPSFGYEAADLAVVGGVWFQATPVRDFTADQPGLWRLPVDGWAPTVVVPGADLRMVHAVDVDEAFAGAWGVAAEAPPAAHRLYRTTDGGATWAPDDTGLAVSDVFAVLRTPSGETLAGTSDGVFERVSTGEWTAAGLAGHDVRDLVQTPDGLVAATSDGLWRREGAAVWTRYGAGLDGRVVYDLDVVDGETPWLVAGTDAGVWATRPLATVATPEAPSPATALRLAPNPTHGPLRLTGGTPGASVEVFDAFGRRVAVTALGADGRAALDVSSLAAGAYVVRVGGGTPARFTVVR